MEARNIKARDLNKSQRAALRRVIRLAQEQQHGFENISTRFEIDTFDKDKVRRAFFSVSTRRDDCGKHSPRRVATDVTLLLVVGPRGGLEVISAEHGIGNCFKTHATRMLGCSVTL